MAMKKDGKGTGLLLLAALAGGALLLFSGGTASAASPMPPAPPPPPPPPPPPAPTPTPTPTVTKIFNPANVPDVAYAHSLACAIANTPNPANPTTTYPTLASFGAAHPDSIRQFQAATALDVDGIVGVQTQRAFDYFYLNPVQCPPFA